MTSATDDTVIENANEGIDLVQARVTYELTANVENLILTGGGNIDGRGNGLANTITGNSGRTSCSASAETTSCRAAPAMMASMAALAATR